MKIVYSCSVFLNSVEVLHEIRICIRKTMGEELSVIIVLKGVRERKGIVITLETHVVTLKTVLKIIYVISNTMPTNTFRFFHL